MWKIIESKIHSQRVLVGKLNFYNESDVCIFSLTKCKPHNYVGPTFCERDKIHLSNTQDTFNSFFYILIYLVLTWDFLSFLGVFFLMFLISIFQEDWACGSLYSSFYLPLLCILWWVKESLARGYNNNVHFKNVVWFCNMMHFGNYP